MEDQRSDEALVTDYQNGDANALEILFRRYLIPIATHLASISFFFKDDGYLDDIRQKVFLTAFAMIRSGQFTPRGPGSFKKWLYRIAWFECLNSDKERRKSFRPVSEVFPEEPTGFPDDLIPQITPQTSDYEQAYQKWQEVSKYLKPTELKLMQLVSAGNVGKKYKEIIKEPEFSHYKSLDYLMRKVYIIRKKIRKLKIQ